MALQGFSSSTTGVAGYPTLFAETAGIKPTQYGAPRVSTETRGASAIYPALIYV
jgi:hypothetical protein